MDITDILRAVLQGAQTPNQSQAGQAQTPQSSAPSVPGMDSATMPSRPREGGGGGGHGGVQAPSHGTPIRGASHRKGAETPPPAQAAGGSAGDILGSILGGTGNQPTGGAIPAGDDPISAILGALMGGASQPLPQTGSGDVLGSILSSSSTNPTTNSFLTPIVNALAEKMDIPPAVAASVVNFAISKLLAAHASGGSHGGLDIGNLMAQMNSNDGVDHGYVMSSGAAQELAQHSGLDEHTAASALQAVYNEIASRAGST